MTIPMYVGPRSKSPYMGNTPGINDGDDDYPIEHYAGHIHDLCRDQNGCRYLQRKLDEGNPVATALIFQELAPHFSRLMTDPFGNYLCQKMIECCTKEQREDVLRRIGRDLVSVSMNVHGTRAVQKIIDYVDTKNEVDSIRTAFKPNIVILIQDPNSNHVIQRCLHKLSFQDKQFIYDAVTEGNNLVSIATHRHGCCVLQRCIDHASTSQKLQVVNDVIKHVLTLVQDQFGNYVVQYVLDLNIANVPKRIAENLKGLFVNLSTQKFSSNVVEKIMQSGSQEAVAIIVAELIAYPEIATLLQDPYANYVIQTALVRSSEKQHKELADKIIPHLSVLRNTPYGKRIQAKIYRTGGPNGGAGGGSGGGNGSMGGNGHYGGGSSRSKK